MQSEEEPRSRKLTPEEAGAWLHVSAPTLARWRGRKFGPAFLKVHAHRILYEVADLRRFEATRRRRTLQPWDRLGDDGPAASNGKGGKL